jgi:RimJ/RimL family protein N-acetyltransferase
MGNLHEQRHGWSRDGSNPQPHGDTNGVHRNEASGKWDSERGGFRVDDDPVVHNVQRLESDGHDLRAPSEFVALDRIRPLEIRNEEHLNEILRKYSRVLYSKLPQEVFTQHLLNDPQSWFVELRDAELVHVSGIIPGQAAYFYFYMWDSKFNANRREAVKSVLGSAFKIFGLYRMNALVTYRNRPMCDFLRKIGFVREGQMRKAAADRDDVFIFGMLQKEMPAWLQPPTIFGA